MTTWFSEIVSCQACVKGYLLQKHFQACLKCSLIQQLLKDLHETCKFYLNYTIPIAGTENILGGLQIRLSGYHAGKE